MRFVRNPIQDGIRQSRVTNILVLLTNRQLGSNDRSGFTMTVFHDLQQGQAGILVKRLKAPIIQDQQLHSFQPVHFPLI